MEKSSYNLSKHVFFCLADNHYVFLDLRRDEYLCLGRMHTDAMKELLNSHDTADELSANVRLHDPAGASACAIMEALLKKELLVQVPADGKPFVPSDIDPPVASLMRDTDKSRRRIRPGQTWHFFAAAVAASQTLLCKSIERTVRNVACGKSACATAVSPAATADYGVIADLFESFQTLRPYYPRPYLCLFDSLALLHFLARYGVFPQWVYGVKLEPFAAHCWVQIGDRVVNDVFDNVRDYTPIMSV